MGKIKTSGAEFKRFYSDSAYWPDGVWHDDEVSYVNGVEDENVDLTSIPDECALLVDGGYVFDVDGKEVGSLSSYFRKWQAAQTHSFFVVEIENSKKAEFIEALKSFGGKLK